MTLHDDDSHRTHNLADLLRDASLSAYDAPLACSDDDLINGVRRRTAALRRRRNGTRSLVAAAASLAVVGAGVAVVSGYTPTPVLTPATLGGAGAFPACGSEVPSHTELGTLPDGLLLGSVQTGDTALAVTVEAPSGAPLTDVSLVNMSSDPITVTSNGYIGTVLVEDSVVVAAPVAAPSVSVEEEVLPGARSTSFRPLEIEQCPGQPAPTDEAGVYTYADLSWREGDGEPTTRRVWANPGEVIVLSDGDGTLDLLACDAPADALVPSGGNGPSLTPVENLATVTQADQLQPDVRVRLVEGERPFAPDHLLAAYLVRDGKIVSATGSPASAEIASGDTLREVGPAFDGTDCLSGELLAPGTYEGIAVLGGTVDGQHVEVVSERIDVTITSAEGLPAVIDGATFPSCGAPEPRPSDLALGLVGQLPDNFPWRAGKDLDTTIRLDAREWSFPDGFVERQVTSVLTQGGRVVSTPRTVLADRRQELNSGPELPLTVSSELCGDDSGTLPAGTYQVWASVTVSVDGGATTALHQRVGSVTYS